MSKTIGELLSDINIKGYGICYGQTRTIKRAHDREALAYIKSFSSLIVIYKKRGGYLGHYFTQELMDGYCYGKSQVLNAHRALEFIKKYIGKNLGEIHIEDGLEQKIIDIEMVNAL